LAGHRLPKGELIKRRLKARALRDQGVRFVDIAARFEIDKKQAARDVLWVDQFNPWLDGWADIMANRYDLAPRDCREFLLDFIQEF